MRVLTSFCTILLLLSAIDVTAQTPSAAAIRCVDCARTGQSAASARDRKPTPTVPRVEPVWMAIADPTKEEAVRVGFVARVLDTSPLLLEVFDMKWQSLDRAMKIVRDDGPDRTQTRMCGGALAPRITNEVKAVEATLAFNDIVTGTWMMQRDPADPATMLVGGPVITALRKAPSPVPYFHQKPDCANLSGQLVDYRTRDGERLLVFNDGGVQYFTRTLQRFDRYRLSADDLATLLDAFREASFDTLANAGEEVTRTSSTTLTLMAARYQVVQVNPQDARLAPVVAALETVASRATSEARLILRTGAARTIEPREAAGAMDLMAALRLAASRTRVAVTRPDGTVDAEPVDLEKSPQMVHITGGRYLWPADMGVSLADVPADGRAISAEEFEKHKAVFTALTNARFTGLTLIEGNRLYEAVRLCQVAAGAGDSCPPAK
jgi:hypothetical protein